MTELLGQIAHADVTVMIEGESGTGKGMDRRSLADAGTRRSGPFIAADVDVARRERVVRLREGGLQRHWHRSPGWFEMHFAAGRSCSSTRSPMAFKVKLFRVLEQEVLRRRGAHPAGCPASWLPRTAT